jgi:hypothetical protein
VTLLLVTPVADDVRIVLLTRAARKQNGLCADGVVVAPDGLRSGVAVQPIGVTAVACGPFWPCSMSKDTRCPSSRLL